MDRMSPIYPTVNPIILIDHHLYLSVYDKLYKLFNKMIYKKNFLDKDLFFYNNDDNIQELFY